MNIDIPRYGMSNSLNNHVIKIVRSRGVVYISSDKVLVEVGKRRILYC